MTIKKRWTLVHRFFFLNMLEEPNGKKIFCNLAGCQLLPEHLIGMGGPEAMLMEPMMDMGMPEIDIGM